MPPQWGQIIYDSTFVTIEFGEESAFVDATTLIGVRKLVNEDYDLTFRREANFGIFDEDQVFLEVSDSLIDYNHDEHHVQFQYLSRIQQENILHLVIYSRFLYPNDENGNPPQCLNYFIRQRMTGVDSVWGMWLSPTLIWGRNGYFKINSNHEMIAQNYQIHNRQWGEERQGNEIIFNINHWRYFSDEIQFGMRVNFPGHRGVIDTLTDTFVYELVDEVRHETPDLIIDEMVEIYIGNYNYRRMNAEIHFEPDLLERLAPLWLWFPHDDTNAVAELHGEYYSYLNPGEYVDRTDTLEIVVGNVNGHDGFYIHVPWLANQNFMDVRQYWRWIDPDLTVRTQSRVEREPTARFILVTAPLEPSQVRFIIPDRFVFTRWESPFECSCIRELQDHNMLIFYGLCPETGISQVWWDDARTIKFEREYPFQFDLQSIFPNPFNDKTKISFSIPQREQVALSIIDLRGNRAHVLLEKEMAPGIHTIPFKGEGLSNGVYFVLLENSDSRLARKLTLIR